jgi:hypothetical protein
VGDFDPEMTTRRARAERARHLPALTGVLAGLLLLVAVQVLLLMLGVEGWLGGRHGILGAAALGSGLCFAAVCWLLRTVSPPPPT